MIKFDELGLIPEVLSAISEIGYEIPTPIQEKVIPTILELDTDLVGLAQTGTGKTAAFGLPIIQKTDTKFKYPQSLILCPTRELCVQIAKDLAIYSKNLKGFNVVSVYGGASIENQIKELRRGAHCVVATPGRMLDIIKRKKVDLSNVRSLVLDEADEMLNMGFLDDINDILAQTPKEKNTYLFSATMPPEISKIAKNYMSDPMEITVGRKNSGSENVEHNFYLVNNSDRYLALKRIADINPDIYSIVFCRTKNETKEVADKLIADGYNADALHGDLSQAQRDHVMQKFRLKNIQMLVATDVAARGIDVNNLTHVINYNLPDDVENYNHRSGRTGRAGKEGVSVAIITRKEYRKIRQIEKTINKKFVHAKVPNGEEICEKQLFSFINKIEKVDIDNEQIEKFLPELETKLQEFDKDEIIKRFLALEFNRFIDYYKNAPDLNISTREDKGQRRDRQKDSNYTRFFINLGKKDNIETSRLIGIINENTRNRNMKIGKIDLMKTFSFFEVENKFTDSILSAFNGAEYNKRPISVEVANSKGGDSGRSGSKSRRRRDGGSGYNRSSRDGGDKKYPREARKFNRNKSFARDGKSRGGRSANQE